MTIKSDYELLIAEAEQVAARVRDAELRAIAFGHVLSHLLGAHRTVSVRKRDGVKRPATTRAAKERPALTKSGPSGYVQELVHEGFFMQQKTLADVKAELENRGHHIPVTSLSGPLQRFCQSRVLRRQKHVMGGGKETYAYSNW